MVKPTIVESAKGLGIGSVFIGEDRGYASPGHAASQEFPHTVPRGLGMGTPMDFFEASAFLLLSRPHRATATQLGLTHSVDEMRSSNEQVQVEGPVLAVLEGPEAIQNQCFLGGCSRTKLFMKEQTVATEAFRLVLKCAVRDAELTADLTKAGAADEAMEESFQQVGVSQPVGRGKSLCTEVPAAMMTVVPLNSVGRMGTAIEALLLEVPRG